jgi:hypothetical protein
MVRIIRIAGALIIFCVTTGFTGASHGGYAKGSGQGSDTAAISAGGNSPGGFGAAGMTAVRLNRGIRDPGDSVIQRNASV